MNTKIYLALMLIFSLGAASNSAKALTLAEFNAICASTAMPCAEIPILQAYIGGAIDLVAMLDEETDYLETLYCVPKSTLLDTTPIIQFMVSHKDERPSRNAMLLLIQYLVENGQCE